MRKDGIQIDRKKEKENACALVDRQGSEYNGKTRTKTRTKTRRGYTRRYDTRQDNRNGITRQKITRQVTK
jgi:hypothetical protein